MPVSQYVVMLSRMLSRVRLPDGLAVDEGTGDLVVGVGVVVDHPGGEGDGGVQQGVADRLRPGRHLQEVAVSAGRNVVIGAAAARSSSVSVGMAPLSAGTSRLVWMPTSPSGACGPSRR